jgi:hypothetical protein
MFDKQKLLLFANSPLSSPLLSIFVADDESVKVHSFYGNMSWWSLWGTWHHYQPLLQCLLFYSLLLMPWCSKFMIKWC